MRGLAHLCQQRGCACGRCQACRAHTCPESALDNACCACGMPMLSSMHPRQARRAETYFDGPDGPVPAEGLRLWPVPSMPSAVLSPALSVLPDGGRGGVPAAPLDVALSLPAQCLNLRSSLGLGTKQSSAQPCTERVARRRPRWRACRAPGRRAFSPCTVLENELELRSTQSSPQPCAERVA